MSAFGIPSPPPPLYYSQPDSPANDHSANRPAESASGATAQTPTRSEARPVSAQSEDAPQTSFQAGSALQPSSLWVHHKSNQQQRQQHHQQKQHQHHQQHQQQQQQCQQQEPLQGHAQQHPQQRHPRVSENQVQQQPHPLQLPSQPQLRQLQPQDMSIPMTATADPCHPHRASILAGLSSLLSYPRSSSVAPTPYTPHHEHPKPAKPHPEQMQIAIKSQISPAPVLWSVAPIQSRDAGLACAESVTTAATASAVSVSPAVAVPVSVLPGLAHMAAATAAAPAAAGLTRTRAVSISPLLGAAPRGTPVQVGAPDSAGLHLDFQETPNLSNSNLSERTSHRPKRALGRPSPESFQPLPTPQLLPHSHQQRAAIRAASARTSVRFRAGPVSESLDQQPPYPHLQLPVEHMIEAQLNPYNPQNQPPRSINAPGYALSLQHRAAVAEESKAEDGAGGHFGHNSIFPWDGTLQNANSADVLRVNFAASPPHGSRGSDCPPSRPLLTLGHAWAEIQGVRGQDVMVTPPPPHSHSIPSSEQTAGGGSRVSPESWSFWRMMTKPFRRERSTAQLDLTRRSGSRGTDPAKLDCLTPATLDYLHIDRHGNLRPAHWRPEQGDVVRTPHQQRMHSLQTLMTEANSSHAAMVFSCLTITAILVSTAAFVFESVPSYSANPAAANFFVWVDLVSVQIFAADYIVRMISCPQLWPFLYSPFNLIDLVSILPWFIALALQNSSFHGTAVFRILRLFRVFRVFKLGGRYKKLMIVAKAMSKSNDMLLLMIFLSLFSTVFFSTLMFFAERGYMDPALGYYVRPDEVNFTPNGDPIPSPYASIPESMWWCIVTLMTVGYGDVVPVSPPGKLIAGITMVAGILSLALPISVVGRNFSHKWTKYKGKLALANDQAKFGSSCVGLRDLGHQVGLHCKNVDDMLSLYSRVESSLDEHKVKLNEQVKARRRDLEMEMARQRHHMKGTIQLSSQPPTTRNSRQQPGGMHPSAFSQRPTPTMTHALSSQQIMDPTSNFIPFPARASAPLRANSGPFRSSAASCGTPSTLSRASSMARSQPAMFEVDMKVRLGQLLGQPLMARYHSDLLGMVQLEGEMMEKTRFLEDLLRLSHLLCGLDFATEVKGLRIRYKQLKFMQKTSEELKASVDEMADEIHEAQLSLADLTARYEPKNDPANKRGSSTGNEDNTRGGGKEGPSPSAGSASQHFPHGMYSLLMASMSSLALGGGAKAKATVDRSQSQPLQPRSWFGTGRRGGVSDSGVSSILRANTGSLGQHPLLSKKPGGGMAGIVGRGAASDSGGGPVARTTVGPGLVRCTSTDRKTPLGLTRLGVLGGGGEREGQGSLSWGPLPSSSGGGVSGAVAVNSKLRLGSVVEHHPDEGADSSSSSTNGTSSRGQVSGGGDGYTPAVSGGVDGVASALDGRDWAQPLGRSAHDDMFGWPNMEPECGVTQSEVTQAATSQALSMEMTSQHGRGGTSQLPGESWQEQILAQHEPATPQSAPVFTSLSQPGTQLDNSGQLQSSDLVRQQHQAPSTVPRSSESGISQPDQPQHTHAPGSASQPQCDPATAEPYQNQPIDKHDKDVHDAPSQAMSADPFTVHDPHQRQAASPSVVEQRPCEPSSTLYYDHALLSPTQLASVFSLQEDSSPVHSLIPEDGGFPHEHQLQSTENSPRRIATAPAPLSHHPSTQERDSRTSLLSAEFAPLLSDRSGPAAVSSRQPQESQSSDESAPSPVKRVETGLSTVLGRERGGPLTARGQQQQPLLLQTPRAPPGVDNSDGGQLQGLDSNYYYELPMPDEVVAFTKT